jgi:hypothetical protein
MSTSSLHIVENKAAASRRLQRKPAGKLAPVIRQRIVDDFRFRQDSEAVAIDEKTSRLVVMDCLLIKALADLDRVMCKLGLRDGFGAPMAARRAA